MKIWGLITSREIIDHQISNGISFDFIGADGYYGNDAEFARAIDSLGYLYMLDVHSDQPIYLERPELIVPQRKSTRGAAPKRLQATTESIAFRQRYKRNACIQII